jgi:hypothetical protein
MKSGRILHILAALVLMSVPLLGSVIFDIYTSGLATSATVAPGDTISFLTRFEAGTVSDTVGSVVYTLEVPDTWVLVSRDYGTHGWAQNDSFLDTSDPMPGVDVFPITVAGNTYPSTSESDFYLSTARPGFASLPGSATYTVEAFSLMVPLGATGGIYNLHFNTLMAATGLGAGLDESWEAGGFDVTVVPEPGSLAFLLLGLPAALLLRRRRS